MGGCVAAMVAAVCDRNVKKMDLGAPLVSSVRRHVSSLFSITSPSALGIDALWAAVLAEWAEGRYSVAIADAELMQMSVVALAIRIAVERRAKRKVARHVPPWW
eukprot:gene46789-55184_t